MTENWMEKLERERAARKVIADEVLSSLQKILDDNRTEWGNEFCYEGYAVRTQDVPFELGPIDHVSHIWDDGEDTGEELDGLCGTHLADCDEFDRELDRALAIHFGLLIGHGGYPGGHTALIGYNGLRRLGMDEYEIIMQDSVVLEVFA